MVASVARVLLAAALLMCAATAHAKGAPDPRDFDSGLDERMRQHHAEMKRLNKIPVSEVHDWTLHKDVDESVYWFSRTLKRSVRDAPTGWTKGPDGEWKAPPRDRDEL